MKSAKVSPNQANAAPQQTAKKPLDPAQLNWTRLGGTTEWYFTTHKIKTISANRLELRNSTLTMSLQMILIVVAIAILAYVILTGYQYLPLKVALLTAGGALVFLFIAIKPILHPRIGVFDQTLNLFWVGPRKLPANKDRQKITNKCQLTDIIGVQFIAKETDKNDMDDTACYELNLILTNGRRQHLMQHGSAQSMLNDGKKLAEFLDVELYKGIEASRFKAYL